MEKSSRKKQTSSNKKPAAARRAGGPTVVSTVLLLAVAAGVGYAYFSQAGKLPSLTGEPHARKAITSFDKFFTFYLTEHTDGVSRLLHVVGTTITMALIIYSDWRFAVSMATALGVGLIVRELTIGLAHGFVEFGAMVVSFLLLNKLFIGPLGIHFLIIGYLFAWIGHFFFEKNQPATFIYPSYSLMGDFKMWYGVLTQKIPITFK